CDGSLLRHRPRARGERLPRRRRAHRGGGAAAPPPGAESVLAAEAGEPASGLPRLAALVRVARLLSQQARGRPLRARAGAERGVWAIGAGTRAFGGRGGGLYADIRLWLRDEGGGARHRAAGGNGRGAGADHAVRL